MKRILKALIVSAGMALAGGAAHAGGLQLSLDGVVSTPRGGIDNPQFKVYMDEGFGVMGDVLYGFGDVVYAGIASGFYRNSGSNKSDDRREELTFAPLHALVRIQPLIESKQVGIYFEVGAGLTFLRAEVLELRLVEPQIYSESAFSLLGGVGFSSRLSDSLAAKLGFKVQSLWPSDEIHGEGALQVLLFTAGLRYHRR
jgi:hypothetical protein